MLHVHRAERADGLVEALRALLADPLPDPFSAEIVSVPTRGMERWLTQRLSARLGATAGRSDGVCANVDFPFPHRLVSDALATASDIEPERDPWQPRRSVWPLLDVVDDCLGEPWLHDLSAHLGGDPATADPERRARRLSRARQLAELFDRYALYRPDMVRAWVDGADSGVWQAELWRRLRERIAQPGPAERLDRSCARLLEEPATLELPTRLSLFGLTRIPAGHLRVLAALAARRDVHLFLLHPSPALWQALEPRGPVVRRHDDATADAVHNRLLASWGQDARELQLVLANAGDHVAHHHPVEHSNATLLARIQADVRADRSPPGAPLPGADDERPLLDPGDRSLRVHACHGRARQVEVLRDAILHELAEDPTLEPRDVIVMCPDIETFAPLIQATFGAGSDELPEDVRPVDLRARLADRSLRQTNPVLGVVAELIDLAAQRLTASQVLDLADREPVRRRFRLDDDDLTRIRDWVSGSGVRWGLDAAHRAPFKLDALAVGTWRFGLDRLLTGVTMTEEDQRLFAGVLPLDDVESGAIDLAGRLAELVDRLQASLAAFSTPKPAAAWTAAIATAADALTTTSPRDAWQRAELQRVLDEVVEEAAASATEIAPAELRALLADRLQPRPTRANFRTGHLTVCTLVPMRSVPHRVVCLLGLDDGAFPRKAPRDGDDLTLDDPRVGERDPRSEDRQMLLDALLAATDRLIVTYTGNDERTNAPQPAAVPVGELLDVVDATVRLQDGSARERVVVQHPLQPFDPRNFESRWSFDPIMLAGARALDGPRADRPPFLSGPLDATELRLVEIEDLVRFAQHPVRAFLRRRLGISLGDFTDEVEDELPIELDGLAKWGIGERLLEARLAGVDGRSAILAEIARGTLPPGVLGEPIVKEIFPIVDAIVAAADGLVAADSVDIRVELANGVRVTGTVPGVSGDVLRAVTYSRVAAKHRITAWVRLLALVAAHSERSFSAVTVGRAGGDRIASARITPPAGGREWALDQLATLVDLYERGMREPLPLYCRTSAAYAAGGDARGEWVSEWNYDKEDREREHVLVLGGVRSFEDVVSDSRFGRYAHRLWDGLLAVEELR